MLSVMKTPFLSLCSAALAALLLSSCVAPSTPQSRIAARPEAYNSLPASQRSLIDQGKIKEGMTKDAVYLAWGQPDRVRESSSGGRKTESWLYEGYDPVYTQHVDIGYGGYGYGGYGHGRRGRYGGFYDCYPYGGSSYAVGTEVNYIPYVARTVDFRNGKVTGWESQR
jgi:hypothetical protein